MIDVGNRKGIKWKRCPEACRLDSRTANPRGYKGRISVGCNRDAEHSHRPQRLLTWWGGYRQTELDTPTILAGLRGDGLLVQGCVIGRLGRTRSAKAGLAVVRFVSEVGLSVACAVPTLAERWGRGTIAA